MEWAEPGENQERLSVAGQGEPRLRTKEWELERAWEEQWPPGPLSEESLNPLPALFSPQNIYFEMCPQLQAHSPGPRAAP